MNALHDIWKEDKAIGIQYAVDNMSFSARMHQYVVVLAALKTAFFT